MIDRRDAGLITPRKVRSVWVFFSGAPGWPDPSRFNWRIMSDHKSNGSPLDGVSPGEAPHISHVLLGDRAGNYFVHKLDPEKRMLRVSLMGQKGGGDEFWADFDDVTKVEWDQREVQRKREAEEQKSREERKKKSKRKQAKPKSPGETDWDKEKLVLKNFTLRTAPKLTPAAVLVWHLLFVCSRGGTVSMTQRQIAKRTGKTQPRISTAINLLISKGLLEVIHQGSYKSGTTSRYRVRALMLDNDPSPDSP